MRAPQNTALRVQAMRAMQAARMKGLERIGFEPYTPRLEAGSRVLIVGAGPSATATTVAAVRGDFDAMISLNSGWKAAPDADVISYEFAFRDEMVYEGQKQELDLLDPGHVVFKPHALLMMPRSERVALSTRLRDVDLVHAARFVPHHSVPGTLLLNRQGLLDRRAPRLPIQWKGSLTMWLDLCWLSQVGTVGLIGTDLGVTQPDGRFVDHPTNTTDATTLPLLSILKKLHRHGYLSGMKFLHFHGNTQLRTILEE